MSEVSFREKIVALQHEWLQDPFDDKRNKDFWFVMDSISDQLTMKWTDRATKLRNTQHNIPGTSDEWLAVCNILYMYNNDNAKDKTLSPGQKRKCIFYIIRMWDDLEMAYFC